MNHPCVLLISAASILAASIPARADLLLDRGPGLIASGNINNWSTSPKNIGWAYSYDAANQVWWMAADTFSLAGQPGATGYRIDSIDLWIGSYATINELNNGAEMRLAGGMSNGTGLTWLQVGAQLTLDSYSNYLAPGSLIDRPDSYIRAGSTNEATPPRLIRVTFENLNWEVSSDTEFVVGLDLHQITPSRVFQLGMGPFANAAAAAPYGGDGKFFYMGDWVPGNTILQGQVDNLGVWNGTDLNMVLRGAVVPEPSTALLVSMGLLAVLRITRRGGGQNDRVESSL